MTFVMETVDALKVLADAVDNIRKIASAMQDATEYIRKRHPEVSTDIAAMLNEMRKTLQAVAAASAIITHFRFTVEGRASEMEPARFNEHLIQYKTQADDAEAHLDSLRGHCHIIKEHAKKAEAAAIRQDPKSTFLKLFGLNSNVRERELGESLQKIYGQEMDVYKNIVKMMSEALEKGLNAVQEALGPPGTMYPKNVRKAARTLGKYAQDFARLETDCNYTALGLQKLIDELGR